MSVSPSSGSPRGRLCLGSVSSLSFEEEENDWNGEIDDGRGGGGSIGGGGGGGGGNGNGGSHHLHDLLVGSLAEQVGALLRREMAAGQDAREEEEEEEVVVLSGLRRTLDAAVHVALRLAEDEPYGVRGATIFIRLAEEEEKDGKDGKGDGGGGPPAERHLGAIAVDPGTASTFNLILTLWEERSFSVSVKNWLVQLAGGKTHRVISQRFTIKKEKLYRSPSGTTLVSFQF